MASLDFDVTGDDITEKFLQSCRVIELGELVHCPNFTLFEAMSGIELMDSKMDSGLLANKNDKPELLNWDDINTSDVGNAVIVEIVDSVLRSIVSFLEGSSLAQTVFTCLYLHDPIKIQHLRLRMCCLALLRILDKCFGILNTAAVFEEEDVYLMTYGFSFASGTNEKLLLSQLKNEAESCRNHKSTDSKQLSLRLSFLHTFISTCNVILNYNHCQNSPGQSSSASNTANQNSQEMKKLPQLLEKMLDRFKLMKQTEESKQREQELGTNGGICKILGFDANINQHLLPPTFPKAAGFPSWFKMHEYFATVMSSFREACVLFANSSTNRCSLSTVINFLSSVATGPKTNLLERSLVQCVVFYNPNVNKLGLGLGEAEQKLTLLGIPIDAFMSKTVSSTVSHLPFTTDADNVSTLSEQFLASCIRPVALFVKCFGKNRSRFREHLVRVNQELFQLEPICIALDNAINTFYPDLKTDKNQTCHRVYSWLSLQASNVMQQFMYLGFELELYSDHELIYIFWYLADFLLIWSCSLQKERLEKFSDELLPQPSQYVTVPTKEKPFFKMQRRDMVTTTSSNQKKNKQQMKQMKVKEFELATQSALLYEAQAQNLKYLQSLLSLFCGYYKSLILLKAAEKLPVVEEKCFDNEKLRFERRIAPIALDADFFPSYEMFCAAVTGHTAVAATQPHMVLQQAAESFSDAKTLLADIRGASIVPHDTELMFKISSNNLIVLNLINQKWPKEDAEGLPLKELLKFKIEFQPQYSNWPIFKLESK